MESSTRARALPSSACRSIRLSRTLTAANSAATKNAWWRCRHLQLRDIGLRVLYRDRALPVEPVKCGQHQHVQRRRREHTAEDHDRRRRLQLVARLAAPERKWNERQPCCQRRVSRRVAAERRTPECITPASAAGQSIAESVLELHEKLIRREAPAPVSARLQTSADRPASRWIDVVPQVVVVDHEQVTERRECPAEPRVGAEGVALIVVLDVAVQLQVWRHVEAKPCADEVLRESSLSQPSDVACAVELDDEQGRRLPCRRELKLVEPTRVEAAEPPRRLGAETTLRGEAALDPVAPPVVAACRDGHAPGDLECLGEALARRHDVELEAIAALEAPVHWRHEHLITLPAPREIGHELRLELMEHLADVKSGDWARRTRLIRRAQRDDLHRRPRHEADGRIESVAEILVDERRIEEIVGIVDLPAKSASPAGEVLAASAEPPHAHEEVLVSSEAGRLIGRVGAGRPTAHTTQRIAERADQPHARLPQ